MDKQNSDEHMTISQKAGVLTERKKRFSQLMRRKPSTAGFFQGLKEELKKVSWTSKQELILCTKIVVGATVFFGFAIYFVDILIRMALNGLHSIVRLIAG